MEVTITDADGEEQTFTDVRFVERDEEGVLFVQVDIGGPTRWERVEDGLVEEINE